MNYSDSSFDYIFAWEVIEHIPRNSEQRMFDEVYRVLKPGGLFFFSTPNRCLRSYFFDPASPFGHRHYSHSKILELGVTAKFIPKELVVRGKLFTGLFILSMYVSKWILRSSNVLERPFWVKRMNQELQKDGWFDLMGVFQKPQA
jgi:SAM-dependent methyltransferase